MAVEALKLILLLVNQVGESAQFPAVPKCIRKELASRDYQNRKAYEKNRVCGPLTSFISSIVLHCFPRQNRICIPNSILCVVSSSSTSATYSPRNDVLTLSSTLCKIFGKYLVYCPGNFLTDRTREVRRTRASLSGFGVSPGRT